MVKSTTEPRTTQISGPWYDACTQSAVRERGQVMAVGLLATITIQEGKNAEFEEAFLDLTELVRANEPGNVFYALHRSPTDPQVYKVMEQYDSPEALDAHGKTDYFREANKRLAGMVAAAPEIEILDAVVR